MSVADLFLFWISRMAGSLATFVVSKFGNASVVGGRVALILFPGFLRVARKQIKFPITFVMGSNGKTTTSKYLVALAENDGEVVLTNSAGSNMKTGIAAMVIRNWKDILHGKFTCGVFEVDEGYAASLGRDLAPEHAVFLNVQIDQIYRLHEPERVADMFAGTITSVTKSLVLNGNDSLLVEMSALAKPGVKISYFGLADGDINSLGLYKPVPLSSSATNVRIFQKDSGYELELGKKKVDFKVPSRGLHYALNGSAAIASRISSTGNSDRLNVFADAIASGSPAFGRGEVIKRGNAQFELILFKNRPSLQLNINSVVGPADTTVLAFDEYSQDPSWLFAVDYSKLSKVDWVSGEKADFLELALSYLGMEVLGRNESIKAVVQGIDEQYRNAVTPSVHRLFLDYEQMLAVRSYFGLKLGVTE